MSSENTTKNVLTKYERVKVLCIRAEQIQRGSPIMFEYDPKKIPWNPHRIALEELKQKKCPLIIQRTLPNGKIENFKVNEMEII